MIISSVLMVNLRRIWRHERELAEQEAQDLFSSLSCRWPRQSSWFRVRSIRSTQHFGFSCAKARVLAGHTIISVTCGWALSSICLQHLSMHMTSLAHLFNS